MEFLPIHIHKTKHNSLGKLLILAFPVIAYLLIMTLFMLAKSREKAITSSPGNVNVLGTQNLTRQSP